MDTQQIKEIFLNEMITTFLWWIVYYLKYHSEILNQKIFRRKIRSMRNNLFKNYIKINGNTTIEGDISKWKHFSRYLKISKNSNKLEMKGKGK